MNQNILIFIIIVLVIVIIYLLIRNNNISTNCLLKKNEYFGDIGNITGANYDPISDNKYHLKSSDNFDNIDDLKLDNMKCDISCCGFQKPGIFDGLSHDELKSALITDASTDKNIISANSRYICANGPNGIGCPCLKK